MESLAFSMRKNPLPVKSLQVLVINHSLAKGILRVGAVDMPCLLGRSGMTHRKREGDGRSPIGTFALRTLLYRADRLNKLRSPLSSRPVAQTEAWCDNVDHRCYNSLMPNGLPGSEERLWREDNAYDVLAILDYNMKPRVRGLGSAIFFHLIRDGATSTAGCIAIGIHDMRKVLPRLSKTSAMQIGLSSAPRKWHSLP
jgi:L,D-peptidoglycan transpeptidase YkuD (ErfK/YbiS/YcfS/YnhG family)